MRTEEEKNRDLVLYEKKAMAKDICEKYEKVNNGALLVGALSLFLGIVALWGQFWRAFDRENILGMALILAELLVVFLAARSVWGGLMMKSRSPIAFLKWGSLRSKWTTANKDMQKLCEKFADQTAFEDDVQRAEGKLLAVSEKLIAFAEAEGIDHRTEF